jgi:hypothetical protein
MPIKSFRGLMSDGEQQVIHLHTNNGSTGYKIVKFRIVPEKPYSFLSGTMMIWKVEQSSVPTTSAEVDFSDNKLLAVGNWIFGSGEGSIQDVTIFDNEIFNQDIYVTYTEETSNFKCNYYLELEQVKLDLNQNTVATLKDIRNNRT